MRRPVSALAVLLLSQAVASAQLPIGHATPVSGFTPTLLAGPVWIGNEFYGYGISGAPPGGSALVAVSLGRQEQVVLGLQVYPDLANVVLFHSAPIDATGRAFIPVPLVGPEIPSLAGADLWAQAAVADPANGALGATQALLLEVTLHPMLAFATAETGLVLIDFFTGTTSLVAGFPPGTIFNDVVFGNGGRDLFVATSTGLYVVDTLALSFTPTLLLPGVWKNLAWDHVFNRVFGIPSSPSIVSIVDGDRSSATFGTQIGQTGVLSGSPHTCAVSADGRVLAISNAFAQVNRVNVDPTSTGYLNLLPMPASPIGFGFGATVFPILLSSDGRMLSVPVVNIAPTKQVWRFDGTAGQWVDYSPALFTQPISSATVTGVPVSFDLLPARDGTNWILSSPTGVVRLDLSLHFPAVAVPTATLVAAPTASRLYLGLSPSGRFLVQRDWSPGSGPSPNMISLVEVATGAVIPVVTLMGATNTGAATIAAWR